MPTMSRKLQAVVWVFGVCLAAGLLAPRPGVPAAEPVSAGLDLVLRDRVPAGLDGSRYAVRERGQRWDPKTTAIIVCDMWDLHHCKRAVERVKEMAPRMNEVIVKARDMGVFIIHAPSSCMD